MQSSPGRSRRRTLWSLLAGVWIGTIGGGMGVLYAHQADEGEPATAPRAWPEGSRIVRDRTRPALVMLAHPRCPCTRASIGELAILMNRLKGRLSATVLFVKPASAPPDWDASGAVASAARIPGVSVLMDEGGREAARLGARTSGQVLLYGRSGELVFAGGITPGRAHMGDNVGIDRIVSLVTRGDTDRRLSSVFGCALFDEEEEQ